MRRSFPLSPLLLLAILIGLPEDGAIAVAQEQKPRLVVLVTIDQFPYSYLRRFAKGVQQDGVLAEISKRGASYTNCRLKHAYTLTGPGHSVVSTGAYPRVTGIIGNEWYDHAAGKALNCVFDDKARIIGVEGAEGVSPHRLMVPTVGDWLKVETARKAKVFSIGFKDRAAVFTAGRLADGVFWLHADSGKWVTSDAYRNDLPPSIRQLNEADDIQRWAGKKWSLLLHKSQYKLHRDDDSPFELPKEEGATRSFPHLLPAADDETFVYRLGASPFGNEMTLRTASYLIEGEQLGKDEIPDLLSVNLSSNDYVGHRYGPFSLEVADMFYRTDAQLGRFIRTLNESVGAGRWSMLITSDHGVGPIPEYAKSLGLLAGREPLGNNDEIKQRLEKYLRPHFVEGEGSEADAASLVLHADPYQIFLNKQHPRLAGRRFVKAQRRCRDYLIAQPAVTDAVTREDLMSGATSGPLRAKLFRSFYPARSGDVLYVLAPFYIHTDYAASHGSPWEYDSHIPLLLLGAGIQRTVSRRSVDPTMIAPTLARLFGISPPPAAQAPPLSEALRLNGDSRHMPRMARLQRTAAVWRLAWLRPPNRSCVGWTR